MKIKHLSIYIIPALLFFSCEKEDPVIPNEEELITTIIYRLEPLDGGDPIEFRYEDLDGDGGQSPIVTSPKLMANTTYHGSLTMLNNLVSPPVDISEEVEEEGEEHQVFYIIDALKVEVEYMDSDDSGYPIGLITSLTTGSATTGSLQIILRHEPKKPNDGTPADAGGATDVQTVPPFDIIVE